MLLVVLLVVVVERVAEVEELLQGMSAGELSVLVRLVQLKSEKRKKQRKRHHTGRANLYLPAIAPQNHALSTRQLGALFTLTRLVQRCPGKVPSTLILGSSNVRTNQAKAPSDIRMSRFGLSCSKIALPPRLCPSCLYQRFDLCVALFSCEDFPLVLCADWMRPSQSPSRPNLSV